ncbi:hypothetical protein D9758_007682 [Tetrapyrgos nigripes]|uniref:MFS general substrate transporter n=1 Tax=Tetrapyrgos nigripes TaxID=182062 RepID=A0A8H5G5J1_9AGAR|nr:hypothetical protein D9758_007682 [Tetrapyrgos nigripes]
MRVYVVGDRLDSIFMLSLANQGQYYQVFLSQGLALAIGSGLIYIPSSSVVSHHFQQRRALAMGFITTGSAIGGFFFSTIFSHFLDPGSTDTIGFAWGVRIGGFISLVCLVLANFLMKTNYPPTARLGPTSIQPKRFTNGTQLPGVGSSTSSSSVSSSSHSHRSKTQSQSQAEPKPKPRPGTLAFILSLLLNPSYSLNLFIAFLVGLASYVPLFSIELFASTPPQSESISPSIRPWLLGIMNLSSVLGRVFPGLIVDLVNTRASVQRNGNGIGAQNVIFIVFGICMGVSGVVALMMPLCTNTATIVVFCVLYGGFQGSATALFIPSVISLTKDMSTAGVSIGVATVPLGIALLVGTPIAGAVVQRPKSLDSNPDWWAGSVKEVEEGGEAEGKAERDKEMAEHESGHGEGRESEGSGEAGTGARWFKRYREGVDSGREGFEMEGIPR